MTYYRKHIFFCVNLRDNGKKCCQQAAASEMREYAKKKIKQLGLSGKGGIRVNSAGCLGRCAEGPVIVIYPEDVWYTYQNESDIDEIITRHLQHEEIVDRLLLKN